MDVFFANPIGFLGLLGLPAILAIHFLQRRSRRLPVTTLFLLERLKRQSKGGNRLERIRSSIPLWLQLLLVALITWLLVQPRLLRKDNVFRAAVIVDGSASMEAFRDKVGPELERRLGPLAKGGRVELVLLESHLGARTLYRGPDMSALVAALDDWKPRLGEHDLAPVLGVGRSLVGNEGLLLVVTDHERKELPFNARVLSVGSPMVNVGFAGLSLEEGEAGEWRWRALIRNYSDEKQERSWRVEAGERVSAPTKTLLGPGEIRPIEGTFPAGADRVILRLKPDKFPVDDSLPMMRPEPKTVGLASVVDPDYLELAKEIAGSLRHVEPVGPDDCDLVFYSYDALSPAWPDQDAVVFVAQKVKDSSFLRGAITTTSHPLVAGLGFQGLLAKRALGIPVGSDDEVLLWQGDRALLFLRNSAEGEQLVLNFDPIASNATRLPAFVVLLHRYAEGLRQKKVAAEAVNLEVGQPIDFAWHRDPSAGDFKVVWETEEARSTEKVLQQDVFGLRSSEFPGFFTIDQGGENLLRGATHFSDTREADFRDAGPFDGLAGYETTLVEERTRRDPFWQLWLLISAAVLILSWWFLGRRDPDDHEASSSQPATLGSR